jgi:hypothetical protein
MDSEDSSTVTFENEAHQEHRQQNQQLSQDPIGWLSIKRKGKDDAAIARDRKKALLQRRRSESPKQEGRAYRKQSKTPAVASSIQKGPKTIVASKLSNPCRQHRGRKTPEEKAKLRQETFMQQIRTIVLGKDWNNSQTTTAEQLPQAVTPEQANEKDSEAAQNKSRKRQSEPADDVPLPPSKKQSPQWPRCRREGATESSARIKSGQTASKKRRKSDTARSFCIHSPFRRPTCSTEDCFDHGHPGINGKSQRQSRQLFRSFTNSESCSQESFHPRALFVHQDFEVSARNLMDSQRTKWVVEPPCLNDQTNDNQNAFHDGASPTNKRGLMVRGILLESPGSHMNSNHIHGSARSTGTSSRPTTSSGMEQFTRDECHDMSRNDHRRMRKAENRVQDDGGIHVKYNATSSASDRRAHNDTDTPRENNPSSAESRKLSGSLLNNQQDHSSNSNARKSVNSTPKDLQLWSYKTNQPSSSGGYQNKSEVREERSSTPDSRDACKGSQLKDTEPSQESLQTQRDSLKLPMQQPSSSDGVYSLEAMLTQESTSSNREPSHLSLLMQQPKSNGSKITSREGSMTQELSSQDRSTSQHGMPVKQQSSNNNPSKQAMMTQPPSSPYSSPSNNGMLTQESSNSHNIHSRNRMHMQQNSSIEDASKHPQGALAIQDASKNKETPAESPQADLNEDLQLDPNNQQSQQSSHGSTSMLFLPQCVAFDSPLTESGSSENKTLEAQPINNNQNATQVNEEGPLQLEYWQRLATTRSEKQDSFFRNALANLIMAKNHNPMRSQQQHGGLLWLPSILEGDLDAKQLLHVLK